MVANEKNGGSGCRFLQDFRTRPHRSRQDPQLARGATGVKTAIQKQLIYQVFTSPGGGGLGVYAGAETGETTLLTGASSA